jgi:glutamate 5-kinase
MKNVKIRDIFVVKIGSSSFTENGEVRTEWLNTMAADISALKGHGYQVLVVCSGAVALGRKIVTGRTTRDAGENVDTKQGYAGIGQIDMMAAWKTAMRTYGITVAQGLMNNQIIKCADMRKSVCSVLSRWAAWDTVAILNENDTVSINAILVGNNDTLVEHIVKAVNLSDDARLGRVKNVMFLTDVDGVWDANKQHISTMRCEDMTDELLETMRESSSGVGTGGMAMKLAVAKELCKMDVEVKIANGGKMNPLGRVLFNGARHTQIQR